MRRLLVTVLVLLTLVAEPTAGSAQAPPEIGGSTDWVAVNVGSQHTCGIRAPGRLYCWGSDQFGQLGIGNDDDTRSTPGEVFGGFTDWTQVAAGGYHTCARRRSGRLYCWGYDNEGQLGNGGANQTAQTPTQVAGGVTTWTSVAVGASGTCATRSTGRLFCWGADFVGQLGNGGSNQAVGTPSLVAGGITDWAAATVGNSHACGRRRSGAVHCWGNDTQGQLGNGPTGSRPVPSRVGSATNWTSVVAGGFHTCGRRATGRLYCWGTSFLGDGSGFGMRTAPREVSGSRTDWAEVAAAEGHTCARRTSGRVFCWGNDDVGQLGNGSATGSRLVPSPLSPATTDWKALDLGGRSSCGRTRSNRLYCWGYDFIGQVGDGGSQPEGVDRASEVYVPA